MFKAIKITWSLSWNFILSLTNLCFMSYIFYLIVRSFYIFIFIFEFYMYLLSEARMTIQRISYIIKWFWRNLRIIVSSDHFFVIATSAKHQWRLQKKWSRETIMSKFRTKPFNYNLIIYLSRVLTTIKCLRELLSHLKFISPDPCL